MRSVPGATAMVLLLRRRLIHAQSAVDMDLSEKKIVPGLVLVPRGQVKPFLKYELIEKGIDKGKYCITLPNGKKVNVNKIAIRRFPQ